jgi:capsular polysaccharide transport system permease protein
MSIPSDLPASGTSGHSLAAAIGIELRKAARQSRAPSAIVIGGGGFRARRGEKHFATVLILSFILLLPVASILTGVYLVFFSAAEFITEARIAIRHNDPKSAGMLSALSSTNFSPDVESAQLLKNYITSRGMVDAVNSSFNLRKAFGKADYLSRLSKPTTSEDLVRFWRKKIDATAEEQSGILILKVRAFSPEDSLSISESVLKQADIMINSLSDKMRQDSLQHSEQELSSAKSALTLALNKLRDSRNDQGIIDPEASAKSVASVVSALRVRLAELDQYLFVSKRGGVDVEKSPAVSSVLNEKLKLEYEIKSYEDATASKIADDTLATRIGALDEFSIQLAVTQERYKKAIANYETARLEADSNRIYLVAVSAPSLAESSDYYSKIGIQVSIFFLGLVIWGTFTGLAVLVRDHMAV